MWKSTCHDVLTFLATNCCISNYYANDAATCDEKLGPCAHVLVWNGYLCADFYENQNDSCLSSSTSMKTASSFCLCRTSYDVCAVSQTGV